MLPTLVLCLGVLLLKSSVEGQSASFSSSYSSTGSRPVTYTHTSGNAQATAVVSGLQPVYNTRPTQQQQQAASRPSTYTQTSGNAQASAVASSTPTQQFYQTRPAVGRRKRQVSTSISKSTPGQPPVTYTFSKGDAVAIATTGDSNVLPEKTPLRFRRQIVRNDGNQQIFQKEPPVGLLGSEFAPPPSHSAPAGISQNHVFNVQQENAAGGGSRYLRQSPYPPAAPAAAEAQAQAAPAPAYAPPVEAGNFAGAQAQAQVARVPHQEYGVPVEAAGNFAGAQAQAAPAPAYAPPVEAAGNFAGAQAQAAPAAVYGPPAVQAGNFAGAQAQAAPAPAYAPPVEAAGNFAGAQAQAAPAAVYGPPAANFAGAQAQAAAAAPPPAPEQVYGLPSESSGGDSSVLTVRDTYGPPAAATFSAEGSSDVSKSFAFVPAFSIDQLPK